MNLLDCLRRMQSLAQNGLTYSRDPYDLLRYEELEQQVAEALSWVTDGHTGKWLDLFDHEEGYATPKLDVRAGVFRDDRVLLVRERSDGKWTLPGGWVDINESPSQAVAKEVLEESGYRVEVIKLAALHDRRLHEHPPMFFHVYKLFFLCRLLGGDARTSVETDGVAFFAESELPELSTGRVIADQIHLLFRHRRQPHLPTEFD